MEVYVLSKNKKPLMSCKPVIARLLLKMKTDADHIHLIIKSEQNISVSQIVRRLKQISTHRIWKKKYLYLKRHFWKKKVFWSNGYFVCSIGNVSMKTVEKYIENQG
jgi:putative transposase